MDFAFDKIKIDVSRIITIFLFFGIIFYGSYRIAVFFKPDQLFFPLGVQPARYQDFYCGNIKMNIAGETGVYKDIPIPLAPDSCVTFVPRGETVTAGFKSR